MNDKIIVNSSITKQNLSFRKHGNKLKIQASISNLIMFPNQCSTEPLGLCKQIVGAKSLLVSH